MCITLDVLRIIYRDNHKHVYLYWQYRREYTQFFTNFRYYLQSSNSKNESLISLVTELLIVVPSAVKSQKLLKFHKVSYV